MIPRNAPNNPIHPLEAKFISQLGIDYLIDRCRARLLRHPEDPQFPVFVQQQLEKINNLESFRQVLTELSQKTANELGVAASSNMPQFVHGLDTLSGSRESMGTEDLIGQWAAAWYDQLQEEIKATPYQVEVPLRLQLPARAKSIIQMLAIARQGMARLTAPDAGPPLAAGLKTRPDSPARGNGKIEVIEVGDLQDPFTVQGHEQILTLLDGLASYIDLRWVHGPLRHHKYAIQAAELTEACAEVSARLFWNVVDHLCRQTRLVAIGAFERALKDLSVSPALIGEVLSSGKYRALVEHDMYLLDAAGVPPIRPALVVGRDIFLGADQINNLGDTLRERVQSKFEDAKKT